MAIDYTTLTAAKTTDGSIKNWVNRGDIPVTNILLEAEAWIYSYLRTREMMTNEALTFYAGNTTCTGSGTSTQLENTGAPVFTDGHVIVGATITNSTDGSTATVSAITDADNIVTTALTGGTLNIWTSGDTYKILNTHRKDLDTLTGTFLDPQSFTPYEWAYPLDFIFEGEFQDYRDASGNLFTAETPSMWTLEGETMVLDVDLTANFSGILKFYAQPAALSGSNETNFVTIRYPTMFRYACMAFAYEHMKDTVRTREYQGIAMAKIMEANATNDLWRRGMEYPS